MTTPTPSAASTGWTYPRPFGPRAVLVALAALALLFYSGERVQVGRLASLTGHSVLADLGLANEGSATPGLASVVARLFPLQIAERQDVSRIAGFDPAHLPLFAHIETERVNEQVLDPETLELEDHIVERTYLVRPFGYLGHVARKMIETLEIALWGTLIAVLIGLPLALLSARNITPSPLVRFSARSTVNVLRATPELISALFLVLVYGFGPIAGYLALGLHGAGALGRFFADETEHADWRPQEALAAIGAGRLAIWRMAVLPQVMPHHIGSTLYVLDRNVRMATVIGLVGAGGIGQELKGRYDMYEYGHVGTILVATFLVVLLLDRLSQRLRRHFL